MEVPAAPQFLSDLQGAWFSMIAALFVERDGVYSVSGIQLWHKERDARFYHGPYCVVAHPPCERWGRYWHGAPNKPHQFQLGDDGGCFKSALSSVNRWGGVLEHPADSHAWRWFGIDPPPRTGGWIRTKYGFTCCVYQGHYGHLAGKPTWLYANIGFHPPELIWGPCEQRLHPVALERYGYEKARRIGMMAMVGGKDKTRIRNATPEAFRDLLISMVRRV